MEEHRVHVITVSGACCMPHLAKADEVVEANLRQAAEEAGVEVEVQHSSLSAILAKQGGLSPAQEQQILALFQKYGARCAPAVLIGDQVRFAGKPPTVEQLKAALQAVAA